MNIRQDEKTDQKCTIGRNGTGWAIGTGLRVGLLPGTYRVTGRRVAGGVRFVQLDERFLSRANQCDEFREQSASIATRDS